MLRLLFLPSSEIFSSAYKPIHVEQSSVQNLHIWRVRPSGWEHCFFCVWLATHEGFCRVNMLSFCSNKVSPFLWKMPLFTDNFTRIFHLEDTECRTTPKNFSGTGTQSISRKLREDRIPVALATIRGERFAFSPVLYKECKKIRILPVVLYGCNRLREEPSVRV